MSARIVLLRHAETQFDSEKSPDKWCLSREGKILSEALAGSGLFDDIESIFSSTERKAIETANPFAEEIGLNIATMADLRELDRGEKILSNEDYISSVKSVLSYPSATVLGWEDPESALSRFNEVMQKIGSCNRNRVLVISHGLVISLFMANLQGIRAEAFDRWRNLEFLSWGEIVGAKVLRDIVES